MVGVIALLLGWCAGLGLATCAAGWKEHANRCYKLSTITGEHDHPVCEMERLGARLAIVQDVPLLTFLEQELIADQEYYYVGLRKVLGDWFIMSDETFDSRMWCGSFPHSCTTKKRPHGPGECGAFKGHPSAEEGLHNVDCSSQLHHICEYSLECPDSWLSIGRSCYITVPRSGNNQVGIETACEVLPSRFNSDLAVIDNPYTLVALWMVATSWRHSFNVGYFKVASQWIWSGPFTIPFHDVWCGHGQYDKSSCPGQPTDPLHTCAHVAPVASGLFSDNCSLPDAEVLCAVASGTVPPPPTATPPLPTTPSLTPTATISPLAPPTTPSATPSLTPTVPATVSNTLHSPSATIVYATASGTLPAKPDLGRMSEADKALVDQGGFMSLAAMVTGPTAATAAGKMKVISNLECDLDDVDLKAEKLDWEFHPTGVGIGNGESRYFLGAVLINPAIAIGVAALQSVVAVVMKFIGGYSFHTALGTVRGPGLAFLPFLFLLQGVSLSASNLAFFNHGGRITVLVGLVAFLAALSSPIVVWGFLLRQKRFHADTVPDPRLKGFGLVGWKRYLYKYIIGNEIWVSKRPNFVEKWGVVFEGYRKGLEWWVCLEMSVVLGLSIFAAWRPETMKQCYGRNALIFLLLFIFLVMLLYLKPYSTPVENVVAGLNALLMCIAVLFMSVAIALQGNPSSLVSRLFHLSSIMLLVSAYLLLAKAVCDLIRYVMDMRIRMRKTDDEDKEFGTIFHEEFDLTSTVESECKSRRLSESATFTSNGNVLCLPLLTNEASPRLVPTQPADTAHIITPTQTITGGSFALATEAADEQFHGSVVTVPYQGGIGSPRHTRAVATPLGTNSPKGVLSATSSASSAKDDGLKAMVSPRGSLTPSPTPNTPTSNPTSPRLKRRVLSGKRISPVTSDESSPNNTSFLAPTSRACLTRPTVLNLSTSSWEREPDPSSPVRPTLTNPFAQLPESDDDGPCLVSLPLGRLGNSSPRYHSNQGPDTDGPVLPSTSL